MLIAPDTKKRISIAQVAGIAIEGNPSKATVSYASGADSRDIEPVADKFDIPLSTAPDLITLSWEVSGIAVSAELELVTTRFCGVSDVRAYQPDETLLGDTSDEEIQDAIDRAESLIERECHRHLQPILTRGWTDRPNCRTSSLAVCDGATAYDIRKVVSATDQNGCKVSIRKASDCLLDVRDLKRATMAEVVLEVGMSPTPIETSKVVTMLAAWYLTPHAAPDNATSSSTDLGFMRFIVGGVDGAATSIPEVNAFIERYGLRDWQVG